MEQGTHEPAAGPRLVELVVADDPAAWAAAGFAVEDDDRGAVVRLGTVALRPTGAGPEPRGITAWTLSGVTVAGPDLDGLATTVAEPSAPPAPPRHPNGVVGLDHVVVATPDLSRTLAALDGAGLDLRRLRDTTAGSAPLRQAFFRLGPTILEVVSGGDLVHASEAGPTSFWGLAVDVADLDATAAVLGEGLGRVKPAVQAGRRIATFRHRDLGLSVSVAAMDRLGTRPDADR